MNEHTYFFALFYKEVLDDYINSLNFEEYQDKETLLALLNRLEVKEFQGFLVYMFASDHTYGYECRLCNLVLTINEEIEKADKPIICMK